MKMPWTCTCILLLCFGVQACAHNHTPPDPTPAPVQETQPPAPQAPAKETEAEDDLPDDLPKILPAVLQGVEDEVAQVFACMQYNHITLLTQTDRTDTKAVLTRLGELVTARSLCKERVERLFARFPLFVDSFHQEWRFYMTYFALTMEPSAVHNLPTFCRRLAHSVETAQKAAHKARAYHQWLSAEQRAAGQVNPNLKIMLQQATEKVSGLGAAHHALQTQHQRECP